MRFDNAASMRLPSLIPRGVNSSVILPSGEIYNLNLEYLCKFTEVCMGKCTVAKVLITGPGGGGGICIAIEF